MGLQAAWLLQRTWGLLRGLGVTALGEVSSGLQGSLASLWPVPFLTSSVSRSCEHLPDPVRWSCSVCCVESGSPRPCLCFPVRGRGRGKRTQLLSASTSCGFGLSLGSLPATACCCWSLHSNPAGQGTRPRGKGRAAAVCHGPRAAGFGGSAPIPPSLSPLTPGAAEVGCTDSRLPRQPWAPCASGAC